LVINHLKALGAIIDGVPDAGRKSEEIIAAFLARELGMPCRTEEILPLIGFVPVERTGVLKIDSAFRPHAALAMHGEIGRTKSGILLETERVGLRPAGVEGNNRLGFHLQGDVRENVLTVIIGVSGNSGNRKGHGRDFSKHGHGDLLLVTIIGIGDFINGQFGLCVDDNMVSVAPEERHLRLEGLEEMDFDAESRIGIAARELCLVEAVLDGGFEVVLPDVGLDSTGVQGENAAGDDFFLDESPHEFFPELLQVLVGCGSEETREAFPGGRMLKCRKLAGRRDRGIVLQFEGQVGQRGKAAKTLIDQSPKNSFSGKGRTSSDADLLIPWRQMGEQLFETDPRRNLFGTEQRKSFHDTLDFREGHWKMSFSRVSEVLGLGYVADSYEKRSIGMERGVARKLPFLTRAKTRLKIGENYAFSVIGAGISN